MLFVLERGVEDKVERGVVVRGVEALGRGDDVLGPF